MDAIQDLAVQVQNNKHNPLTATYYLLIKKYERNTDQNLVFGKFTRDKRILQEQRFQGVSNSLRELDSQQKQKQSILSLNKKNPITSQSIPLINDSDMVVGESSPIPIVSNK